MNKFYPNYIVDEVSTTLNHSPTYIYVPLVSHLIQRKVVEEKETDWVKGLRCSSIRETRVVELVTPTSLQQNTRRQVCYRDYNILKGYQILQGFTEVSYFVFRPLLRKTQNRFLGAPLCVYKRTKTGTSQGISSSRPRSSFERTYEVCVGLLSGRHSTAILYYRYNPVVSVGQTKRLLRLNSLNRFYVLRLI